MWGIFVFIGLSLALIIYSTILSNLIPHRYYTLTNILIASGAILLAHVFGLSWQEMGFETENLLRNLAISLSLAILTFGILSLLARLPSAKRYLTGHAHKDHSFKQELLLRLPFGTALSEEILFRAVLLGLMISYFNDSLAIVVAAIIFGLWHIAPTLANIKKQDELSNVTTQWARKHGAVLLNVVVTAAAGLALGQLRLWFGFVACWLVHTAVNGSLVLAARRQQT